MRQFDERLPQGSRSPGIFSAHFLEESLATKLFRLISLGNRPPQNFSAHFLEESAATKLFRLISSGNRPPQNCFGSFPQEIGCHKTVSAHFLRKSAAHLLTHFLRKSMDGLPLISSGNQPDVDRLRVKLTIG